jgi:hypothetical protein
VHLPAKLVELRHRACLLVARVPELLFQPRNDLAERLRLGLVRHGQPSIRRNALT